MNEKQNGFTMMELMIAVVLAIIVTTAAMSLYLTQHEQMSVQEDVADMHWSLRSATEELSTRIRMVGFRLPDGFPCIIASNTDPDTIKILFDTCELNEIQIEHSMPQPSSELRCDGHDLTGINEGDSLYIYDPVSRSGEYFIVTQVQFSSSNIQHNTTPLSRRYPAGSIIIKMNSVTYYIDTTDPNHPKLMYKFHDQPAQAYADNITDLNLQYILSSGAVVDIPSNTSMLREVKITLSARADKPDNNFFTPYRTRTLTTRVKVRNIGVN